MGFVQHERRTSFRHLRKKGLRGTLRHAVHDRHDDIAVRKEGQVIGVLRAPSEHADDWVRYVAGNHSELTEEAERRELLGGLTSKALGWHDDQRRPRSNAGEGSQHGFRLPSSCRHHHGGGCGRDGPMRRDGAERSVLRRAQSQGSLLGRPRADPERPTPFISSRPSDAVHVFIPPPQEVIEELVAEPSARTIAAHQQHAICGNGGGRLRVGAPVHDEYALPRAEHYQRCGPARGHVDILALHDLSNLS